MCALSSWNTNNFSYRNFYEKKKSYRTLIINETRELVLPISIWSATDPLAFKPMLQVYSVLLFLQQFQQKTSNANWKDHFEKYPCFSLPFLVFFLNHTIHKNSLAESLHVWE